MQYKYSIYSIIVQQYSINVILYCLVNNDKK